MAKFKIGDQVRITEKFVGGNRGYVGRVGVIMDDRHTLYDQVIALDGDEANRLSVNEEEIEHISDDSDLREVIASLPGLEDASLVWNSYTDPVEFLEEYGATLDDLLTYYKRVEAKHQELVTALAVVRNV